LIDTKRDERRRESEGSNEICWRGNRFFFCLKVPRQCNFVLLVEVQLREGKVLGSGLRHERRNEIEQRI
jgi:hypothetical protein